MLNQLAIVDERVLLRERYAVRTDTLCLKDGAFMVKLGQSIIDGKQNVFVDDVALDEIAELQKSTECSNNL